MRREGSGDRGAGRAACFEGIAAGLRLLSCRTGPLRVARSLRDLCTGFWLVAEGDSSALVGAGWGLAGLHLFQEPDDADADETEKREPTEDVDEGPESGLATELLVEGGLGGIGGVRMSVGVG